MLDALLGTDKTSTAQPVDLLGHSMGGNVAMMYAGVRPERVRRLINLEGFGLPAARATQAPRCNSCSQAARWRCSSK
jgi:pimeloyl-ACP methyl ester carboxylesterase